MGLALGAQTTGANSFDEVAARASEARDANQLERAVTLYQQGLKLSPGWQEGWWSLGTIQYDRSAYPQAAAAFEKLSALDAKSGSARIMLGLCEFELHQDQNALLHIQEGERLGVADNQQLRQVALFHEGVLQRRAGKFEAARQAFQSLCAAGVESPELALAFGMTALRIEGADAPATPSASLIVPQVGAAECLASLKKFDQARTAYQTLERNYSDFPNLHYAFGRFLLDAHDTPAGITELEEAIKLHPAHVLARLQIAAAEYKIDSSAGLPYAAAAVKLDPRMPFAHYLYGLLLLDTDDYQRAIPQLELAEKGMPGVAGVYAALAAAYSRAGRQQDAKRARAAFLRYKNDAASAPVAPQP